MAARSSADAQARRTKVARDAESIMNSGVQCRGSRVRVGSRLTIREAADGSGTSDGRVRHNLGWTRRDLAAPGLVPRCAASARHRRGMRLSNSVGRF
jgi:hypothetical protein